MEWDEQQQALILALGVYRDQVHGPCGGYLPDTTAPEAEDAYRVGDATRCHLCTAQLLAVERYKDARQPMALLFPAERD